MEVFDFPFNEHSPNISLNKILSDHYKPVQRLIEGSCTHLK